MHIELRLSAKTGATRLTLVLGPFLFLLLILCTGDARSNPEEPLERITLQLKWLHHFQFAGYYAAIEKGFYREAGLEVALVEGRPGVDFVEEVISGRANFGVELPGLLVERSKGKPVVALAAIFQHSPLILVTRKDSGIETPQDLRGHTVMIRYGSDAELLAMFVNEGIPLEEIQLSELSWDLNDLIDGKVDAIHAYITNDPFALRKKNVPYTVIRPLTYGIDFYGDCLFTSEKEIKDHPERVKAFREASLRGWAYAMKHTEEIIDLILTEYDSQFSRDSMLFEAKRIRELMLPDLVEIGHMNPGRWQHIRDIFVKLNIMESNYDLDDFLYDPNPDSDYTWTRWIFGSLSVVVTLISVWTVVLIVFNRHLQRAVENRTQELSDANMELSAEIEDRKQTELALRVSEQRLRTIFEQAAVGVALIESKTGCFIHINQHYCNMVGYTIEEMSEGKTFQEIVHPDDLQVERDNMARLLAGETGEFTMEKRYYHKNGSIIWVNLTVSPTWREGEEPQYHIAVVEDISERKMAAELIEHQATFDALTDLPNRQLLLDRVTQAIAHCRRHDHLGAALFIDLDDFKHINDSLGHPVGDALLQAVARRLKKELREEDTSSRLGGDEFMVLFSEVSDDPEQAAQQAQIGAEKILNVLSAPYTIHDHELHINASIGIAMFPMGDESADDVIKHADTAMYRAKEAGRNTIRFFIPSMQLAAEERLRLKNDLRQALLRGEWKLHFQPQLEASGNIVGAEALLRWQHPERGNVAPNYFISVAEKTGQILAIGEWVLENALRQLKTWTDKITDSSFRRLAVNVCPRQFHQVDFVTQIERILGETGADPNRLTLELTEGVFIENLEDTVQKIGAMKRLGVRFSLDDFGTGYSSLAYLKRLPLDEIKIDRSFVRDITTDPSDANLVETIITMAEHLGLEAVAEGVETEEQLRFLQEKGCRLFQGYYFNRPLPVEKFTELINKPIVHPQVSAGIE